MLEFPYYYLPLLVVTTALIIGTLVITKNNADQPVHGIRRRCNPETDCSLAQRLSFDTTFLCCEDQTFWPAAHIVNPLGVRLLTGDPFLAGFLVFVWEALEADFLTYFRSLIFYPNTPDQLETTSGSLIGDAQINGVLGILLADLIASWSGFPGVLPLVLRHGARQRWTTKRMRGIIVFKYFVFFVIHSVLFVVVGNKTAGGFLYGPLVVLPLHTLFVLVLLPRWIRCDDVVGFDMHTTYVRAAPLWSMCVLVISAGGLGWHFSSNDFFQVWMLYYLATLFVLWWTFQFD